MAEHKTPGASPAPRYVTCACAHCGGHIEFNATGFEQGETRAAECPHCQSETNIFVPEQEKVAAVVSQTVEAKESAQLTLDVRFKCEICDRIIEAKNVRLGESLICPQCKCTQFIPIKNVEAVGGAKKQIEPGIACAGQAEPSETLECLQKTADHGNADAQNNLGWCYATGQGVAKDEAEAIKWYRKAAEQGHAQAQYNLGGCYANGQGVAKDEAEAVKWYRKAAEQNGFAAVAAQFELFSMYDSGRGVPQDDVAAVGWTRKSAEQGSAVAQTLLGVFYANGHGVPQDLVQAHVWLSLGIANGDEGEREALTKIEKYMTPEQKAAAAKLASELIKKFKSPGWLREAFEKFKSQRTLATES